MKQPEWKPQLKPGIESAVGLLFRSRIEENRRLLQLWLQGEVTFGSAVAALVGDSR
jgi:hypothetical protein